MKSRAVICCQLESSDPWTELRLNNGVGGEEEIGRNKVRVRPNLRSDRKPVYTQSDVQRYLSFDGE